MRDCTDSELERHRPDYEADRHSERRGTAGVPLEVDTHAVAARLLRDPAIRAHGNASVRARAIQAEQRTCGNHAVQRATHSGPPVAVQRWGWDDIANLARSAGSYLTDSERQEQGGESVRRTEDEAQDALAGMERQASGGLARIANELEYVPVLGGAAAAGVRTIVEPSVRFAGGAAGGAVDLAGGLASVAANPIGTARGVADIAGRFVREEVAPRPLGDLVPEEQASRVPDEHPAMQIGRALTEDVRADVAQGNMAGAAGRGMFDMASMLLPILDIGRGAGAVGQAARIPRAVGEAAEVARGAETAGQAARLARGAEAAGELAEGASGAGTTGRLAEGAGATAEAAGAAERATVLPGRLGPEAEQALARENLAHQAEMARAREVAAEAPAFGTMREGAQGGGGAAVAAESAASPAPALAAEGEVSSQAPTLTRVGTGTPTISDIERGSTIPVSDTIPGEVPRVAERTTSLSGRSTVDPTRLTERPGPRPRPPSRWVVNDANPEDVVRGTRPEGIRESRTVPRPPEAGPVTPATSSAEEALPSDTLPNLVEEGDEASMAWRSGAPQAGGEVPRLRDAAPDLAPLPRPRPMRRVRFEHADTQPGPIEGPVEPYRPGPAEGDVDAPTLLSDDFEP